MFLGHSISIALPVKEFLRFTATWRFACPGELILDHSCFGDGHSLLQSFNMVGWWWIISEMLRRHKDRGNHHLTVGKLIDDLPVKAAHGKQGFYFLESQNESASSFCFNFPVCDPLGEIPGTH
jgi:hypothetical protein